MQLKFDTYTLENGLKIIVHEDHSIPKVVVDIVYRVGSKDEEESRTGFAHLFEHLMFEGSKHIEHYDEALQRVGGQSNAFTNSDITNYYISLPANQLETGFWLESDRMLELDFSEEKLAIQKSVVIEEFKQRYLNQPYGDAYITLRDLHFQRHPYKWPTIGKDISHIEAATLADVKSFFYGYYAPNNATMVVLGDVKPDEVYQLAEKWFGSIPQRQLKKHTIPQEEPQTAPKVKTVKGNVPLTAVYKMFHIPAHTERAYYIADIITDILANGKSSLLYQHMMIEKQVSPRVTAFSWGMHDPGAISIEGKIAPEHSTESFEQALQEVFEQLQNLDEQSLQRIKNKLSASFILQKTNMLSKAVEFAVSDALGNPELINQIPDIYQSIQLEEVKQAAQKYLSAQNSSTLYYLPDVSSN